MSDPGQSPGGAAPSPAGAPGAAQQPPAPSIHRPARRRGLLLVALLVLAGALAWSTWHWTVARHQASTDNAYVAGNVVQITPQLSGTVVAVLAEETDFVRAGQPLVRLDAADARVALEQAEAQLAQAVREVRALFASSGTGRAQVALREAELGRAQADLQRAQAELARAQEDQRRRAPLVGSGAVGQEEFQHALAQERASQAAWSGSQSAVAAAQAALQGAREQLAVTLTQTEGTRIERHPQVQRAAARVREAFLALQRTELLAPVDGHVAKRAVQLGQRVQAGAPMLTLVSLRQLWVDANFKESQLQDLRIGQPAEMVADVYGRKTVFHGRVLGLGAGTGSAFALLPAQNATGNWIKVVQRVPVRIALDPQELAASPLRIGLSMDVTVDTRERSGSALSEAPRADAGSSTGVFDLATAAADAAVQRVVAEAMGRAPAPARPKGAP